LAGGNCQQKEKKEYKAPVLIWIVARIIFFRHCQVIF